MTSENLSTAEKIRCLVAATPGSTTAEIAGRLGIWRGVALRALETLTYAGVVERRAESSWRRGRPAPTWFPASKNNPPTDHYLHIAEVLAVVDRHGRATIDEVVFELADRHAKARTRAIVHRMLQDGIIDAVNGSIGRPEAVNDRTTFGKALIALRTLSRPFVRAEAVLLLQGVSANTVDTILLRACELGYLTREGHHFRSVVRRPLRKPTPKDVIAAFPKGVPISLLELRARMVDFNTRSISSIVAGLVEHGEVVRTGRGAYALSGVHRGSGVISMSGRIAELLGTDPDRDWSATEIARKLGIFDVQDVRMSLAALCRTGHVRRMKIGVYRHSKRRREVIRARAPSAARPGTAEARPNAAAKRVHAAIMKGSGVSLTSHVMHATKLSAASFRGGLNLLVDKKKVCIAGKYLVSLVPPARLDTTTAPPQLRVLAAVLAHGSINAAIRDGALDRTEIIDRAIRRLVKLALLVELGNDTVANSFQHLAPLRKLARTTGITSLTPVERRVFVFAQRNPGLRKTDIASGIGVGRGVANRAVDAVVAKGLFLHSDGRYWSERANSAGRLDQTGVGRG